MGFLFVNFARRYELVERRVQSEVYERYSATYPLISVA